MCYPCQEREMKLTELIDKKNRQLDRCRESEHAATENCARRAKGKNNKKQRKQRGNIVQQIKLE